MARVEYQQTTLTYPGSSVEAVKELDLTIDDGEFVVLVGPSGSGKSTALRMLAGLEPVTSGKILIDGVDVAHKPPKDRDIAMVFQSYALYPHMSVADNMGFALKLQGVSKQDRAAKVQEAAKLLDLQDYLGRKPKALSGGQRQRVAMGRAIVRDPAVFLMDEPLSNLDAKLRVETRANIAALQTRLGTTTVYVTHDQVEAMTMGDRVAVLQKGVLQQVDTPRNLYDKPCNAFVAGFIGSPAMNLRTVPVDGNGAKLGNVVLPLADEVAAAVQKEGLQQVMLGVRPESFTVSASGESQLEEGAEGLRVEVRLVEELGADAYVYGALDGDTEDDKPFTVRFDGRGSPRIDDVLSIHVRADEQHVFHPETGERL